jgi:hypothetical protein
VVFLAGGIVFAVEAIVVKDPILLGAGGAAAMGLELGDSYGGFIVTKAGA